jgi:hypothetical protein
LGRMLRICLRFGNDQFSDQMTVLLHKGLEEEQAKLYQEFLFAAGSDAARALCIAPGALQYGRRRMKAVANDSRARSQAFPSSSLLRFVAEQRAVQSSEFDVFVETVSGRIAANAQDLAGSAQSRCTVLLWQEFLGGWCPTTWSSVYCEDILAQWQRLKQSGGTLTQHHSTDPDANFRCQRQWNSSFLFFGSGIVHGCWRRRRGYTYGNCAAATIEWICTPSYNPMFCGYRRRNSGHQVQWYVPDVHGQAEPPPGAISPGRDTSSRAGGVRTPGGDY